MRLCGFAVLYIFKGNCHSCLPGCLYKNASVTSAERA